MLTIMQENGKIVATKETILPFSCFFCVENHNMSYTISKEKTMTNMNEVIAKNISNRLNQLGRKQNELAESLTLPKQTVSKMLSGTRMISAPELTRIAAFCKTTMEALVAVPDDFQNSSLLKVFMGKVQTAQGRKGIETADKLIDLYLFHAKYQSEEFKKGCSKEWTDE